MRYNIEHKDETRLKVLAEAAEAIRESGPEKVSVQAVMNRAGLTQGGFYAHFKSKDDLIAHAVPLMFEDTYKRFFKDADSVAADAALNKFIDRYLSTRHCDNPGRGCPVPTLSSALARMPAPARKNFAAGVKRLTQSVAGLLTEIKVSHAEETAASVLAEMVGALSMARTIHDVEESEALLKSSRTAIKRRLGLLDS